MKKTVDVLLPLPIDQLFSYATEKDTEISIGDYVVVPFGRKRLIGIVWKYSDKSDRELKCIEQKIDLPSIRPKLIEFAEWVAQYNVIPIGMLAKVTMGGVLKVNQIDKLVFTQQKQEISEIDYQLNPEQQAARDKIISNLNEYSVTLLDGETGSGKTEVYLSVIAQLIKNHSTYAHCLPKRHNSILWCHPSVSFSFHPSAPTLGSSKTGCKQHTIQHPQSKNWIPVSSTGMTPFAMQFTFKNKRYVIPASSAQLYECYNTRVIFTRDPVTRHWNLTLNKYAWWLHNKNWIPDSCVNVKQNTIEFKKTISRKSLYPKKGKILPK